MPLPRRAARRATGAITVLALVACAAPTFESSPSASPSAQLTSTPRSSPAPAATNEPTPEPTVGAPPSWTELTSADGPAPREDHTWRADGEGATAYLFGGRDGATSFDDLWAYDLASDSWTRLTPEEGAAPAARFGHEAAWVDGIGLVIFAGQQNATTFFNDLWAYDPEANAWRELPSAGAVPAARYGSCAAIGPDGRLWISHGFTADTGRFSDTRAYDFVAGAWTDETPAEDRPVARCLHGCWWTETGSFVLYAGQTTGVIALGDLWRLRRGDGSGGHAWQRVETDLPAERNLYAATRVGDAALVLGGQAIDGGYLDDLWRFPDASIGPAPVEVAGTAPPGRSGAELIWDAERHRLLLFGGRDADGAFGDLWELPLGGDA